MIPVNVQDALHAVIDSDLLLRRLFLASLELVALGLVMAMLIRLARIRSPRIVYFLWLLVLVKPLVSLTAGSPLPIVGFKGFSPHSAASADCTAFSSFSELAHEQKVFVSNTSADNITDEPIISDTYAPATSIVPGPEETSEISPVHNLIAWSWPRVITSSWLADVILFL